MGGDKKKKPRKKDKLKSKKKQNAQEEEEKQEKNTPDHPVFPQTSQGNNLFSSSSSAVKDTFQSIKKNLSQKSDGASQPKQQNYDYLMSLFEQYDSNKPANINKIQYHQKESQENIKNYIDKISQKTESISRGNSSSKNSSSSSAANYLKDLMERRQVAQKDTEPAKGGLGDNMHQQSQWQLQQRQELDIMREKYLNMGDEANSLTPADMLNLTFEYNKKKALLEANMNCQDKQSKESSSSSSCRNEAGFNIFEEMFTDSIIKKGAQQKHTSNQKNIFENSKKSDSSNSEHQSFLMGNIHFNPMKKELNDFDSSSSSRSQISSRDHKLFESKFLKFFEGNQSNRDGRALSTSKIQESRHPFLEQSRNRQDLQMDNNLHNIHLADQSENQSLKSSNSPTYMKEQKIDMTYNKDNLDITEVIDMPENLNQKVNGQIELQNKQTTVFDKSDESHESSSQKTEKKSLQYKNELITKIGKISKLSQSFNQQEADQLDDIAIDPQMGTTLSNITLQSQSFFYQSSNLTKNTEQLYSAGYKQQNQDSGNQLLKIIQNGKQLISLLGASSKCPVCFQQFQDQNQNRVRSNLRLPLKLFCGDTICQLCVSKSLTDTKLTCQVCLQNFKIRVNSKENVIFGNKWSRIKDQFGALKVNSHQSIQDIAMRSIPIDHDVTNLLHVQKSALQNAQINLNEYQNSMIAQEPLKDLISPEIDFKPKINSDQVPMASTKFQQKILRQKTLSILENLDQTKSKHQNIILIQDHVKQTSSLSRLQKKSQINLRLFDGSENDEQITLSLSDKFQGFYKLQKDPLQKSVKKKNRIKKKENKKLMAAQQIDFLSDFSQSDATEKGTLNGNRKKIEKEGVLSQEKSRNSDIEPLKKQNNLQSVYSESSETCKTLLNMSKDSEEKQNEKGATLDQINQSQIIENGRKLLENLEDSTSSAKSNLESQMMGASPISLLKNLRKKRAKKAIDQIYEKEEQIDQLMMQDSEHYYQNEQINEILQHMLLDTKSDEYKLKALNHKHLIFSVKEDSSDSHSSNSSSQSSMCLFERRYDIHKYMCSRCHSCEKSELSFEELNKMFEDVKLYRKGSKIKNSFFRKYKFGVFDCKQCGCLVTSICFECAKKHKDDTCHSIRRNSYYQTFINYI